MVYTKLCIEDLVVKERISCIVNYSETPTLSLEFVLHYHTYAIYWPLPELYMSLLRSWKRFNFFSPDPLSTLSHFMLALLKNSKNILPCVSFLSRQYTHNCFSRLLSCRYKVCTPPKNTCNSHLACRKIHILLQSSVVYMFHSSVLSCWCSHIGHSFHLSSLHNRSYLQW